MPAFSRVGEGEQSAFAGVVDAGQRATPPIEKVTVPVGAGVCPVTLAASMYFEPYTAVTGGALTVPASPVLLVMVRVPFTYVMA